MRRVRSYDRGHVLEGSETPPCGAGGTVAFPGVGRATATMSGRVEPFVFHIRIAQASVRVHLR